MNLFMARAIKRMSQWDLARKTGFSQAQISLYENGYRIPSQEAVEKIAEALGLPSNQIDFQEKTENEPNSCAKG